MASVYARKGIYWTKYRGWDGKYRQESTGCRNIEDARAIATQLEFKHAMARKGLVDPAELDLSKRGALPIEKLMVEWCRGGAVPGRDYRKVCEAVLRAFTRDKRIATAAEFGSDAIIGKIESWIRDDVRSGCTLQWLNQQISVLKAFGEWLRKQRVIRVNAAGDVDRLRGTDERRQLHRAFTPQEARRLCTDERTLFSDVAPSSIPQKRRVFYDFRLWTGFRATEALRIQRKDLHLAEDGGGPLITVRREITKNKFGCTLPIARGLASRLADFCGMAHPEAYIFGGAGEGVGHRGSYLIWLRDDLRAVGIDAFEVNVRSFRMSHNTWLQLAGVTDGVIGVLRRDKGAGAALLRRWNYSDFKQLMPMLREQLDQAERWFSNELRAAERIA